jgi:hypothetical protein
MPSGETLSEEGHERGFGLVELERWNFVNEEDFLTIGYYSSWLHKRQQNQIDHVELQAQK